MRTSPGLAALVVVPAVLLAGCGPTGPTVEQWTDSMCAAVLPFVRTAVDAPAGTEDPAQRLRALSDYLGRTTQAADGALGDLDRLGPAPVDDGEALSARLQGGLGEIRSAFSGARSRVDALDAADPAAVQRDLPAALEPLARLGGTTGPLEEVTGNPAIAAAFRASPVCTDLTRSAEQARSAPPPGAAEPAPNGSIGEGGGS
ncbi:hypothetical protein [Pseudonocardia sp. ICBG1293]|uniref:hypothetical protein n=1 Tax=Pseudonocardia sp. ICBG1293 TaxID=2844382 RepID=UPI001CCF4DBC|nr:hypothetical protein [Pseudonocardia sp. ICBG1293]